MATIINDLRETFRRGDIHIRLIFINAAVFLTITITQIVLLLFNINISSLIQWLEMPASVTQFLRQPWAIITYMFMHAGVMHLLFNMLWLYWFGQLFLYFFSARHLRGLYLLGGLCGALLYLFAYSIFPFFTPYADYTFMVGASAAVLAIVAAVAYREPDYRVNLILLGSMPLKYFALIVIGLDLLFITTDNAGGHIAHLGGALGGLLFACWLNKGTDLTSYINNVIDFFSNPSSFRMKPRKPKMKVNYGKKTANETDASQTKPQESKSNVTTRQERISKIREKIKQSGYQGLTEEEKKDLFNSSIH
ncbi:MAG: rhomboid family intramembrane serine protease [Bacteroidaceae bacterium]|nr:rhomboid family intramembrane serine protease [Bacteroidaceae bacterium]